MSNFWDNQIIIGTIEKNKNENVVISTCERNGKQYLDIRIHAKSKNSEEYVPTSKGMNMENSRLKELRECLDLIKDI